MIHVKCFTFNSFAENTYLLYDDSKDCIIIDPGCYSKGEEERLKKYISDKRLKVVKNINTHCHIDHVLGNYFVCKTFGVDLLIPEGEQQILRAVSSYAASYGFSMYQHVKPADFLLQDRLIAFGNSTLSVLFVPGHSPGHLAFYAAEEGFCVSGDVLFRESVGRSDLPGGNEQILKRSIHEQMFALPDNTVIYCGHGPTTSIGYEKRSNPFCSVNS